MQSGMPWEAMMQAGQKSMGGLGSLLTSLFTDPSAPYNDAMDQLKNYFSQAQGMQSPFYGAGTNALGPLQDMLKNMSNPSDFVNGLMKNYNQSPTATYQLQQSQRAGNNSASASGLLGSTPFAQQMQQNAQGIVSGDQNKWLQNVLGVNNQALGGYQNLAGMGANSANQLTQLLSQLGINMGQLGYGKANAQNQNTGNMIQGGLDFLTGM